MERILNKVDDNLREKIREVTKDGKIHPVKENKINADTDRYKKDDKSKTFKETYVVNVEKKEKYEVEAFEVEEKNKTLGRYLDVKE